MLLTAEEAKPHPTAKECICAPPGEAYDMGVPPFILCGDCRARLDPELTDKLAALAAWALSNAQERMDDVGRQRTARVRCLASNGDRPVWIDNLALLAHAERVTLAGGEALRDIAHQVHPDGTQDPNPLAKLADHQLDVIGAARGITRALVERAPEPPGTHWADAVEALDGLLPLVDSLLHVTTKRGRDHAQHVAAVALMAQFLLDTATPHGGGTATIAEHAAECTDAGYDDLCRASWFASLFHDIGYPFAQFMDIVLMSEASVEGADAAMPFPDRTRDVFRAISTVLAPADTPPDKLLAGLTEGLGKLMKPGGRPGGLQQQLCETLYTPDFPEWFCCPEVVRVLIEETPDYTPALIKHGLVSAGVCVLALRKAGLDPAGALSPPAWLRRALQAIALHDSPKSELRRLLKVAGSPVVASGGSPTFAFNREPITFLVRLVDSLHTWERYVKGKGRLVQEARHAELLGLIWPLASPSRPAWVRAPRMHIILDDQTALAHTSWEHQRFSDDLSKHLAELPLPGGWFGPDPHAPAEHLRFQISLPEVIPGPSA
jgi:hypothetical protein